MTASVRPWQGHQRSLHHQCATSTPRITCLSYTRHQRPFTYSPHNIPLALSLSQPPLSRFKQKHLERIQNIRRKIMFAHAQIIPSHPPPPTGANFIRTWFCASPSTDPPTTTRTTTHTYTFCPSFPRPQFCLYIYIYI